MRKFHHHSYRNAIWYLAINGSSRKQGNTGDMIDIVLSELSGHGHQVDKIDLAGHTINPCKACFACAGKRNCVFTDDIFRDVYERMTDADVIIMGFPTYSADVSSTLKAVIERASVISDTNPGMFSHKDCTFGEFFALRDNRLSLYLQKNRNPIWKYTRQTLLKNTDCSLIKHIIL